MLRVEYARWGQTPADLRRLATSAPHPRTRERFLALYEITQESCATRIAEGSIANCGSRDLVESISDG